MLRSVSYRLSRQILCQKYFKFTVERSSYAHFFHTSSVQLGRNTGSSALDAVPRPFSKKQKRRKRLEAEAKELVRDPRKEKLKEKLFEKQAESKYVEKYFNETEESISGALKEMMLPDSISSLDNSLNERENKGKSLHPNIIIKLLGEQVSNINNNTNTNTTDQNIQEVTVTFEMAQSALGALSKRGRILETQQLFQYMLKANFPLDVRSYTNVMAAAAKVHNHTKLEETFNQMIQAGIEPDEYAWSSLVHSKATSGDADGALKLIDQLKSTGVAIKESTIYTSVLNAFVNTKRYDDANNLWLRMHDEGVDLLRNSFHVMLKLCYRTSQPERAFFYMDEMKVCGVEPTSETFAALFRACAEAPQWVNGYQNIVFDAMDRMEGAELIPTTGVYNSIINAFSRSGDAIAAEFYFREMRRKKITQDIVTYNSLLNAYA
eukprot:gene4851-9669_t